MQRFAQNPSDLLEGHLIYACDAVAASADVSSGNTAADRIDVSNYEYLLVGAIMGDGDTAVAIQVQDSATAAGTLVDVSGALISLAATDDNKMKLIEVRCHGLNRYVGFNVTGTGGTASDVALFVLGIGSRRSSELATLTTAIAEKGLS